MIIVRNEKLIKRNTQIGKYSGIIAIVILGGGMYLSFQYQDLVIYSMVALILGFVLSQVGIFYTNRFGRSPRPDQKLDNALKGLDDQYALYHYQSPVDHLLVGPAGIWILFPHLIKGKIIFDDKKGRWKKIGGNFYLKFFAQDSIGNPDQDIDSAIKRLQKGLGDIPDFELPVIKSALVFTNELAEVDAENAPYPTLHARQLKKVIRKEAKGDTPLPIPVLKTVQDFLGNTPSN
ncbi:MAG: hypothetical protein GQ562_08325 [Anaerolineales bacterium]|nr:hypothetical protein [Anaerolineales bacterium]